MRPSPPPDLLASTTLIRDLEELRASILHRLDSIEGLAARRAGRAPAEASRTEQALRRRIDELESERGQLRADLEREESHWKQLAAQLEGDRRLLAEAWERLERERIEAGGARAAAAHPPRPNEYAAAPPHPAPRPAAPSEAANPVAETILRQFQALCNDVRRTTEARCPSR